MDGTKLELTDKPSADLPATYKAIPEADMEEAVTRPKSIVKSKPTSPEIDGADEKMLPKEEHVDVKVVTNEKQNGDAKLDIGELKTAFVGLTKEELMKYANDPFWVRLRWFLFIGFWVLWGMMLLGAVMIILAAPKCNPPPPRTWWEKGPLAEIEDNNPEIVDKLKELGVTGVIIPWHENPYTDVDDKHIKPFIEKEINVIVELQPSYSPLWFNLSTYKDPEFSDYYIWQPPKESSEGPQPPNNWVSVKNLSSWIFSPERKEYYYAPTGVPHLNFRNPNVTQRFSDVIKKFLGFGVGGIRIKGAPTLLVDSKFSDETHVPTKLGNCVLTDYCFYVHSQTENLNDLAPLLKQWRDVVKNGTDNGPFMISEELSSNIEAYKLNNSYVVDLPLQSHLFAKPDVNASSIIHCLNTAFTANNLTWPLWKTNSTSEWDIFTYLLPGTPLITPNASENKEILNKRSSPSVMRGSFTVYSLNNNSIVAYTRVTAGNPGTLVAYNPTDQRLVADFPAYIKAVSEEVTLLQYSNNYNETNIGINLKHKANSVPISPKSAIVLSYVPKAD